MSNYDETLDNMVEEWHFKNAGSNLELHEYLGMTWPQYQKWVLTSEVPEGWTPPNGE